MGKDVGFYMVSRVLESSRFLDAYGYGKGMPVGLVMEELNIRMRYY